MVAQVRLTLLEHPKVPSTQAWVSETIALQLQSSAHHHQPKGTHEISRLIIKTQQSRNQSQEGMHSVICYWCDGHFLACQRTSGLKRTRGLET